VNLQVDHPAVRLVVHPVAPQVVHLAVRPVVPQVDHPAVRLAVPQVVHPAVHRAVVLAAALQLVCRPVALACPRAAWAVVPVVHPVKIVRTMVLPEVASVVARNVINRAALASIRVVMAAVPKSWLKNSINRLAILMRRSARNSDRLLRSGVILKASVTDQAVAVVQSAWASKSLAARVAAAAAPERVAQAVLQEVQRVRQVRLMA
jgi:hypothetical protein